MDLRAPQTFVGIDVPDTSQHALVEQQRLDVSIARTDTRRKLFLANQEWVSPKYCQFLRKVRAGEIGHPPKAAWVCITQFTPVIEFEPNVRMLRRRLRCRTRRKLP